jgi:DCN1-like protein 1/2
MLKFLEDLNLHPESRTVLLLAWKFKAATQCEFTRDEFVQGMSDLGCGFISPALSISKYLSLSELIR